MARISFDSLVSGSTVSVYSDGRVDAVELAMAMSKKSRNVAGNALRTLKPKLFDSTRFMVIKLPGKGNLSTKLLYFRDAIQLVMVLPGDFAKETRLKFADMIERYFAGDASLHSEIEANATSSNPVCEMARESLHAGQKKRSGEAVCREAVKRMREVSSVVNEVQPVTMAMKQDVREAGVILAKAQPVIQVMKKAAGELKQNIVEVSAVVQVAQPILVEMTSALEAAKPLMMEMKAVMGEIKDAAGAYERIQVSKEKCYAMDEANRGKKLAFIQAKADAEAEISRQVKARELEYLNTKSNLEVEKVEVARVKDLEFLKAKALVEAEAIAIVAKAKKEAADPAPEEGMITVKSVADKHKLLESVDGDQNQVLSQAGRYVAAKTPFPKGMVQQGQFRVCGYDPSDEAILIDAIKEAVLSVGTKGPLKITDVSEYCTLNKTDKNGRKIVFNATVAEMKAYLRANGQPILGKEGNYQTFAAHDKDKLIEILHSEQRKYLLTNVMIPSGSGLMKITQIFPLAPSNKPRPPAGP